jgi:hypothetical protein
LLAFFTNIKMTSGNRSDALPAYPLSSSRRAPVGLEQLRRLPPVIEDRSRSCRIPPVGAAAQRLVWKGML